MKQRKTLSAVLLALTCMGSVAATAVFTPAPAYAQKAQKVGAKVGKPLKEAQELAQKGSFKEALAKVKEAQAVDKKTAYEEHTINEFLGYVAVNLKDYKTAATAFEATTTSGLLAADQLPQRLKTVIQLYYQNKNYDKALTLSNRYLSEVGKDQEIQLLTAQIAYIKNDFAKSGQIINEIISSATARGQKPKEEWLQLAMSCAFKQNNIPGVASSLKQLVTYYPSKEYWEQILDIASRKTGLSDKNNLDYYRLRYETGIIKDGAELVEMAQLAIQAGLPGEAKAILDKGFADKVLGGADQERQKRLLTMATNQSDADFKSLAAVEKEANAAKTGDSLVGIGEAYTSYGQHAKAIELIQAGIAKGSLKNADDAKLRLALAYLRSGNKAEALKTFRSIPKTGTTGEIAELWALRTANS